MHAVGRVACLGRAHVETVDLRDDVRIPRRDQHVGLVGRHGGRHAVEGAQYGDLVVTEAERRGDAYVVESRRVEELIARKRHVGRSHAQPREEARAEQRYNGDGRKAPGRLRNRPHDLLVERVPHAASDRRMDPNSLDRKSVV